MNKDPEGYGKDFAELFIITEKKIWSSFQQWNNLIELILVFLTVPITVIASTKKIKSLVTNIHLLTQAIRHSSKLVSILDGTSKALFWFCLNFLCLMTQWFVGFECRWQEG
jgi:hypothetical protein